MIYDPEKKEIISGKVINELDRFVIDFVNILEKYGLEYVIVSGYVAIVLGRSRSTEDVDMLIKPMPFEQFDEFFQFLLNNGYECANTSISSEAYEFLNDHAIRFFKLGKPIPNIEFKIIGNGYNYDFIRKFANHLNIQHIYFLGYVDYNKLPVLLSSAHIGLGIFGNSKKAGRVIPNKAYEILALKLPLITGDSAAARELLVNKKNCILCRMADEKSLVDSILLLKNDSKLRRAIASEGYRAFKKNCSVDVIGEDVKKVLLELCRKT